MGVQDTVRRRQRGGGRAAKRELRTAPALVQMPYISRRIPLTEVLSLEGLEIIENNAEIILAEIGIDFHDDEEALAIWRDAGADVQGIRVRLPRGLARSLIASAPETFTQHARNPERSVQIGGDATVFAPVYGPPFVRDLDGGRRYATFRSNDLTNPPTYDFTSM